MEFSSPPKKYKSALRMLLLLKMQNLVLQPIQSCQDQLAALAEKDGTTEEALKKHILGLQWLGHLLEPSEIAATAIFLASDDAAAITGESLGVTGGE